MKLSSSLEADWSTPQQPIPQTISQGTVEYKRAGMALFLLGFASFSLIYCVQPLLPNLSQSFHIAPSASALALSLTTGFLARSCYPVPFHKHWAEKASCFSLCFWLLYSMWYARFHRVGMCSWFQEA